MLLVVHDEAQVNRAFHLPDDVAQRRAREKLSDFVLNRGSDLFSELRRVPLKIFFPKKFHDGVFDARRRSPSDSSSSASIRYTPRSVLSGVSMRASIALWKTCSSRGPQKSFHICLNTEMSDEATSCFSSSSRYSRMFKPTGFSVSAGLKYTTSFVLLRGRNSKYLRRVPRAGLSRKRRALRRMSYIAIFLKSVLLPVPVCPTMYMCWRRSFGLMPNFTPLLWEVVLPIGIFSLSKKQ